MEFFVASIMLIGIGVMLRAIKLKAALIVIGLVVIVAALLPSAGRFSSYIPSWVFWGVVIILGVNLLRTVLGVFFGKGAADNFTGSLLTAILTPVISFFEWLVKAVFRTR